MSEGDGRRGFALQRKEAPIKPYRPPQGENIIKSFLEDGSNVMANSTISTMKTGAEILSSGEQRARVSRLLEWTNTGRGEEEVMGDLMGRGTYNITQIEELENEVRELIRYREEVKFLRSEKEEWGRRSAEEIAAHMKDAEREALRNRISQLEKELKTQVVIDDFKYEREFHGDDPVSLHYRIKELGKKCESLEEQYSVSTQREADLQDSLSKSERSRQQETSEYEETIDKLRSQISALEITVQSSETQRLAEVNRKFDKLRLKLEGKDKSIEMLQQKIDILSEERDDVVRDTEMQEKTQKIAKLEKDLLLKVREVSDLKAKLLSYDEIDYRFAMKDEQCRVLEDESDRLRKEHTAELHLLEEKLETMKVHMEEVAEKASTTLHEEQLRQDNADLRDKLQTQASQLSIVNDRFNELTTELSRSKEDVLQWQTKFTEMEVELKRRYTKNDMDKRDEKIMTLEKKIIYLEKEQTLHRSSGNGDESEEQELDVRHRAEIEGLQRQIRYQDERIETLSEEKDRLTDEMELARQSLSEIQERNYKDVLAIPLPQILKSSDPMKDGVTKAQYEEMISSLQRTVTENERQLKAKNLHISQLDDKIYKLIRDVQKSEEYKLALEDCQKENTMLATKYTATKEALDKKIAEVETLTEKMKDFVHMQERLKELTKEIEDNRKKLLVMEKVKADNEGLKEDVTRLKKENKMMSDLMEQFQNLIEKLKEDHGYAKLTAIIKEKEGEISRLEKIVDERAEFDYFQKKVEELKLALANKEEEWRELIGVQKELADAKVEVNTLTMKLEEMTDLCQEKSREIVVLKDEIDKLETQIAVPHHVGGGEELEQRLTEEYVFKLRKELQLEKVKVDNLGVEVKELQLTVRHKDETISNLVTKTQRLDDVTEKCKQLTSLNEDLRDQLSHDYYSSGTQSLHQEIALYKQKAKLAEEETSQTQRRCNEDVMEMKDKLKIMLSESTGKNTVIADLEANVLQLRKDGDILRAELETLRRREKSKPLLIESEGHKSDGYTGRYEELKRLKEDVEAARQVSDSLRRTLKTNVEHLGEVTKAKSLLERDVALMKGQNEVLTEETNRQVDEIALLKVQLGRAKQFPGSTAAQDKIDTLTKQLDLSKEETRHAERQWRAEEDVNIRRLEELERTVSDRDLKIKQLEDDVAVLTEKASVGVKGLQHMNDNQLRKENFLTLLREKDDRIRDLTSKCNAWDDHKRVCRREKENDRQRYEDLKQSFDGKVGELAEANRLLSLDCGHEVELVRYRVKLGEVSERLSRYTGEVPQDVQDLLQESHGNSASGATDQIQEQGTNAQSGPSGSSKGSAAAQQHRPTRLKPLDTNANTNTGLEHSQSPSALSPSPVKYVQSTRQHPRVRPSSAGPVGTVANNASRARPSSAKPRGNKPDSNSNGVINVTVTPKGFGSSAPGRGGGQGEANAATKQRGRGSSQGPALTASDPLIVIKSFPNAKEGKETNFYQLQGGG